MIYTRDELTYRNARLLDTPFFGLALKELRKGKPKYIHITIDISELVKLEEEIAVLAADRFKELHASKEQWIDKDTIEGYALWTEYFDLRDVFWRLPQEMTNEYFSEPFLDKYIRGIEEC